MSGKAEKTSKFIIETVAPVFNKHGYIGTSMSDLTEATGLTKGAIYGNFENKESLALASYEYNSKILLTKIDELLEIPGTALNKIYNLTNFYKQYDVFIISLGGCPILNTGIDAFNNNRLLTAANRETLRDIEGKIALVLENGVHKGELKLPVTPLQFAKQLFTMLLGAISMFTITQDRKYLINTVSYLDLLIKNELKTNTV